MSLIAVGGWATAIDGIVRLHVKADQVTKTPPGPFCAMRVWLDQFEDEVRIVDEAARLRGADEDFLGALTSSVWDRLPGCDPGCWCSTQDEQEQQEFDAEQADTPRVVDDDGVSQRAALGSYPALVAAMVTAAIMIAGGATLDETAAAAIAGAVLARMSRRYLASLRDDPAPMVGPAAA